MASEYYYAREGKKYGPLSSAQLRELADKGRLKPTDLVWKQGMPEWVPASAIKGLFAGLEQKSQRPPLPKGSGGNADPTNAFERFLERWKKHSQLAGTILSVAVLMGCCGFCLLPKWFTNDGPGTATVDVEGDTAKVEMVIHHGAPFVDNLDATAFIVGEKVYEVAEANPKVKKIELTLKMSKQGIVDHFGNEWTEDQVMGTITVSDCDEIRKYTSAGFYATDATVKALYMVRIKSMKHAHLLAR